MNDGYNDDYTHCVFEYVTFLFFFDFNYIETVVFIYFT